jgi:hypothetical protein
LMGVGGDEECSGDGGAQWFRHAGEYRGFGVCGIRIVCGAVRFWAVLRKAIQSFRLRLHSGLRQRGRRLRVAGLPRG